MQILIKSINTDSKNHVERTALHMVVKKRDLKMLKLLVENEANINAQDNKSFSVLYYAVLQNLLEIAKYLLNNEANPNLENSIGNAPIHNIAYRNRFAVLPYQFTQKNGNTAIVAQLKRLMSLIK